MGAQLLIDFISLPSWAQILIWAAGGLVLSSVVTTAVRSITSAEFRAEHNDETGVIVAIVGVFYGLVVTALLVKAVTHFDSAKAVVEREANFVDAVVRQAAATSPELGKATRDFMLRYLQQTTELEWPQLQQGHHTDVTTTTLDSLSALVGCFAPADDKQRITYSSLLTDLDHLYEARRERSFRLHNEVSIELWTVSLAGECGLVFFAMLMQMRSRWMHFLMASALSVSISVVFALILIFDTPFSGDISISPEPYEMVRARLGGPTAATSRNPLHEPNAPGCC
jgi:hypothetical protein